MKKQLLFAVVALSAALLVGCDPNKPTDPSTKATLTISQKVLVLVKGDNPVGLTATLTPADAGKTIKWSSSNPDVVSVTNRGFVEAVEFGDAWIYATVDGLKDSCFCHVQTYMEGVIFNSAFLYNIDTTYYADPTTGELPTRKITASSGETFLCYESEAYLWLFSDGFYVTNSYEFGGAKQGVILEMSAPIFYGTKYLNPGADGGIIFSLGEWQITDTAGNYMRQGFPGKLNEAEYIAQQKKAIAAFVADDASYVNYWKAAANAFDGPTLKSYEYMNIEGETGYFSSYVPEAIAKSARVYLSGDDFPASENMYPLDYSLVEFQQLATDTVFGLDMGLNLGYNEETNEVYFNDDQVHYNPISKAVYGNVPGEADEAAAPQMKVLRIPAHLENQEVATRLNEQIKNNPNITIIRKH
jgi:hypothetical protein